MAITVTADASATAFSNGISLRVEVLTNTAATQNGAAANSVTAEQVAITTTVAGSRVYGAALNNNTSYTVNGSTTGIDNIPDATNGVRYGTCKQAAATVTPGSVTIGFTTSRVDGGIAVFEVKPSGTITEDASAPVVSTNTGGKSTTSASFTPPAGALLVALASALSAGIALSDSSGLTWTQKSVIPSGDGMAGVWVAQVAGGTSVSGADTGTGTDTGSVAAAATGADTGTGTAAATLAATAAGTDTASATDAATVGVPVSGSDTGAGTDTASAAAALAGADTAAATDTASVAVAVSGADTVSGTDTASIGSSPVSGADTGTGTDSASVAAHVTGADTATGTDSASVAAAVTGTDTGTGTGSASSAATWLAFDPVLSRVLVSLSGLRAVIGSDDTAAIQRSPDQVQWTTVRGGTDVAVTSAARDLPDYEFTPDLVNYYRAVRSGGGIKTLSIVTLLGDSPWIKNLRYPFLNMAVKLSDAGDITRAANGSAFLPVGDSFPVAVPVVRGGRQFTLTVETDSDAGTASLDALLSTGDVLLLQVPAAYPVPAIGGYYYAGDTTETRNGVPWAMRWTDLALTEAVPPSPDVTPITSTWTTLVSDYATWADVAAGLATWDDVVSLVGAPPDVVIS